MLVVVEMQLFRLVAFVATQFVVVVPASSSSLEPVEWGTDPASAEVQPES